MQIRCKFYFDSSLIFNQLLDAIISICDDVARGKEESYATTSMRKVDLILEFNFLSSSNFLSRLVLQVISVPSVV